MCISNTTNRICRKAYCGRTKCKKTASNIKLFFIKKRRKVILKRLIIRPGMSHSFNPLSELFELLLRKLCIRESWLLGPEHHW